MLLEMGINKRTLHILLFIVKNVNLTKTVRPPILVQRKTALLLSAVVGQVTPNLYPP